MYDKLLVQITTNSLVLTANRRLADTIRERYDQQQITLGHAVWQSPSVLPLSSWLLDLWRRYPFGSEQVLSDCQEQCIWSTIIEQSQASAYPWLHIENTAQRAKQAWQLLQNWQVSLDTLKNAATTVESCTFIEWAEQFIQQCQQKQWLSAACLPQRLMNAFPQHPLPWPSPIFIIGFDELAPLYVQFIEHLKRYTTVKQIPLEMLDSQCQILPFVDLDSEITHMARWAKEQIENFPQQKIGCVIPQLTECRQSVARIFKQLFAIENQLPGATASPLPYNISAGQSLTEFDIITTALHALSLALEPINSENIADLLQSPYICQNETDTHMGALLDVELRQTNNQEISHSALFSAIARLQPQYPQNTWLKRWREFFSDNPLRQQAQLPSMWAEYFFQQLKRIGWPGGRGLNSLEYQLLNRWQQLFTEFTELDVITGIISAPQAFTLLQTATAQIIFQPQGQPQAAIQILGVLESSGLYFDKLWVMGLDDQSWPPPAQPNPFLPYPLQIKMQMPHACAQREFVYSQQITRRLLGAAHQVWLSGSANQPDQPARLSALIKQFPQKTLTDLVLPPPSHYTQIIFNHAKIEMLRDEMAPPISLTEKIHGGSAIVTKQAECPFRAFASIRLSATALPETYLGLSRIDRGILVHRVLERTWRVLKTQQHLIEMTDEALQELLENIAQQTIMEYKPPEIRQANPLIWKLETNRLVTLLTRWLLLEKNRPPFRVLEQETKRYIELSGLKLQLQIDRIDQLEDNSYLLIDYKTGKVDPNDWLGNRPQQPQLPLYCVYDSNSTDFSAIAFAQLQPGEFKFSGLHSESSPSELFPPGIRAIDQYKEIDTPKTWQELLDHWRQLLEQLSQNFVNGHAQVDPAKGDATCRRCDLQMLCRINSVRTAEEIHD